MTSREGNVTEVWLAFVAGLAGSPHCLGMCGGIVAALAVAGSGETHGGRRSFLLLYNLGRVTTYALLGVVAGLIGSSLNLLPLKEATLWIFVAVNLFVLLIGVGTAAGWRFLSIATLEPGGASWAGRAVERLVRGAAGRGAFPLGLALGLLPCGLVYATMIVAAATGSPLRGGAVMAALGCGTFPALYFFGSLTGLASGRGGQRLLRLIGIIVAAAGLTGLWRVLGALGFLPPCPF